MAESVKSALVGLLEQKNGEPLSGEEAAKKLNVTREAVWKAVKSLVTDGYHIESVPRSGYVLQKDCDVLSRSGIEKYLTFGSEQLRIEVQKQVTSTNTVLRERAEAGEKEGLVLATSCQTAGRGRRGRSFYSPDRSGLYFSMLLRPELFPQEAVLITTAAAASMCEAIEKTLGLEPSIKWVNDIFCRGKKVCGILTEASIGLESGRLDYAVLGLGVNVYVPDGGFPPELMKIAGFLASSRCYDLRNRVIATFLDSFGEYYKNLGEKSFVPEYRRRSFALGKQVDVLSPRGARRATALDIDDDCRLLVKYGDDTEEWLSSGEISIKCL